MLRRLRVAAAAACAPFFAACRCCHRLCGKDQRHCRLGVHAAKEPPDLLPSLLLRLLLLLRLPKLKIDIFSSCPIALVQDAGDQAAACLYSIC